MNRTYFRPVCRLAVVGSAALGLTLGLATAPSFAGLPATPALGLGFASADYGVSTNNAYIVLARGDRGGDAGGNAGGDPNGADAGADPNGAGADADPNGADAGADPNGADAGADPNGADAGGDPNGADAGGDPNGADAGGDPNGAGADGGGGGEQARRRRRDKNPPRKQPPKPPAPVIVLKKPVLAPPPVALTIAVPKVMISNVSDLHRECGALLPEFRIHCLAVKIRRIARDARGERTYRPMAKQLLRAGKKLNRIARRNRDNDRRSVQAYRPIRTVELRQAMAEARRVIRETETLLLRSADPSNRRPYRRVSRGIASTKRILR